MSESTVSARNEMTRKWREVNAVGGKADETSRLESIAGEVIADTLCGVPGPSGMLL